VKYINESHKGISLTPTASNRAQALGVGCARAQQNTGKNTSRLLHPYGEPRPSGRSLRTLALLVSSLIDKVPSYSLHSLNNSPTHPQISRILCIECLLCSGDSYFMRICCICACYSRPKRCIKQQPTAPHINRKLAKMIVISDQATTSQ
jgi:hypothetical protein